MNYPGAYTARPDPRILRRRLVQNRRLPPLPAHLQRPHRHNGHVSRRPFGPARKRTYIHTPSLRLILPSPLPLRFPTSLNLSAPPPPARPPPNRLSLLLPHRHPHAHPRAVHGAQLVPGPALSRQPAHAGPPRPDPRRGVPHLRAQGH